MAASIPTADDVRQIVREELERALGRGREWLSTTEAAHRAGVQPKTVRAWVASGDLPASYRGRRRAIKAARRAYDLRRTGISFAREDGARADILKRGTHAAPREVIELYTSVEWRLLCEQVECLRVRRAKPAKVRRIR